MSAKLDKLFAFMMYVGFLFGRRLYFFERLLIARGWDVMVVNVTWWKGDVFLQISKSPPADCKTLCHRRIRSFWLSVITFPITLGDIIYNQHLRKFEEESTKRRMDAHRKREAMFESGASKSI